MKEILVVINTLGRAGAETALMELLRRLDQNGCHVSLYVLMNQGEMVRELPEHVDLLNRRYDDSPVLSKEGRRRLWGKVFSAMWRHGAVFKNLPYLIKNAAIMRKNGRLLPDKLLWRVLSDGGQKTNVSYDLAVAFLEGGSAYYVADHVQAAKKAVFFHVDYLQAGYARALDRDCYLRYDRIFPVSDEVKASFLQVYPECAERTEVFHNMVNPKRIREKAELPGGFADPFDGKRILTVGRLTAQKALELSIEAMRLLKDAGEPVRWYVLGDGDRRAELEEKIRALGLEEDFLLLGAVDNPYPYMKQADLYVHASRFEGKSIAIQEAQILGKAILVSDCSGNREQVNPGTDGMICSLTPESIFAEIRALLLDESKRARLGAAAALRKQTEESELEKLLFLLK